MPSIVRCNYIFLAIFIQNAELTRISQTIGEIVPEYAKKSLICLVNTNITFDFPASRFYGRNSSFWRNPGKARVMPSLYIMELSQEDNLESVLFDLHRNALFDPKATYLLVTKKNNKSVLTALETFYISEAFVVTPKGKTYRVTSKPFKMAPIRKQDIIFQASPKAQLDDTTGVTLKVSFMRKPPFVICPECLTDRGMEVEIFDMAADYLNIKVEYVEYRTTYWGEKLNGSYTFLFKEMFDRKFDVGMGQIYDFDECHFDFDRTPIHGVDAVQFVVPKARKIEQFNLFSYVFQGGTVLIYILVVALVYLVACVLNGWKNKVDKLVELLQVALEVSLETYRLELPAMRSLYGFFMLSIIIFNTGLKSTLFWALTMEHFEHQVNSWEDIVRSGLIPVFNNRTYGYFYRDNYVEKFFEAAGVRNCDFSFKCVDVVAFHRNVTHMKLRMALQYYSPRIYVDEEGRALIHIIDKDVQKFHFRFFFVKGHPAFPRFSKMIGTLVENGITDYITTKLLEDNKKAQAKAEMNYHGITVNKLQMRQLMDVVYLYIGGILLSLLVFCLEVTWR